MKILLEIAINNSIKLELLIHDLYLLFHKMIPEDSTFWEELALEERNHSILLKKSIPFLDLGDEFPSEIVTKDLDQLINSINFTNSAISKFKENPSRDSSFKMALEIEGLIGEIYYQNFFVKLPESDLSKLFYTLNGYEKDHYSRIENYMKNGLLV
jgi:rubrerythrin